MQTAEIHFKWYSLVKKLSQGGIAPMKALKILIMNKRSQMREVRKDDVKTFKARQSEKKCVK